MSSSGLRHAGWSRAIALFFSFFFAAAVSAGDAQFRVVHHTEILDDSSEVVAARVTLDITNTDTAPVKNVSISLPTVTSVFVGDLAAGETRSVESEVVVMTEFEAASAWDIEYDAADGSKRLVSVFSH
jgi:hypothetical protein